MGKVSLGEYIKRQGKEYMKDKEKERLGIKRRLLAEKILEVNKRRQEILKTRKVLNRKMRESVGFTSDFKKCSAMIAQYVYVRDFINGEHNKERMMDYLETLNMLATSKLDLSEEIHLEREHQTDDEFCRIFAKYWQEQLNSNFQWHIFFAMLLIS